MVIPQNNDFEPARKRILVNVLYKLLSPVNHTTKTPQTFFGNADTCIAWEYDSQKMLETIPDIVDKSVLDGKVVLDVGCAFGGKPIYYAKNTRLKKIYAFEPQYIDLEAARNYAKKMGVNNCVFEKGYGEKMPYRDDMFDIILMDDVMEHVDSPEKTMRECYRVLKPGGKLIAKFPTFRSIYAHHLDRAVTVPGVHYLLPQKVLVGGLNYINEQQKEKFLPFGRVRRTPYRRAIHGGLNGIGYYDFKKLIKKSRFNVEILDMAVMTSKKMLYHYPLKILTSIPKINEILSLYIVFIGRK